MNVYPLQKNQPNDEQILSDIELKILRSTVPLEFDKLDDIRYKNRNFLLLNKHEIKNWNEKNNLEQYPVNEDSEPFLINKKPTNQLEYVQKLAIRYLRPPTPKSPYPIVIKQSADTCMPPAPPLVIRVKPSESKTPEPLIIREHPPQPPTKFDKKLITVSGKKLPPPPRKVIIERLPPLPKKPPPIIIERWLPYSERKRKVIYKRSSSPTMLLEDPKNVVVDWDIPEVEIERKYNFLGVVKADPIKYTKKFGKNLIKLDDYPDLKEYVEKSDKVLEKKHKNEFPELEGDIFALKLIDLEKEGLGHYKNLVHNNNSKSISSTSLDTNLFLRNLLKYDLSCLKTSYSIESFIDQVFDSFNSNRKIKYDDARNIFINYSAEHGRKFDDTDFINLLKSSNLKLKDSFDLSELKDLFLNENFIK